MSKARVKTGNVPYYLTKGKWYKIESMWHDRFAVVCDEGQILFCLLNDCAHLGSGSWEIKHSKLERIIQWTRSKLKKIF
jgi:hypothetical protein